MERDGAVTPSARRRLGRRADADLRGLARAPRPMPPSVWVLPDPDEADEDGVVGVGADLAPPTLVDAYRRGIFPWPHPGVPLPWFSPDPRGVLDPTNPHCSRSLRRTLRRNGWSTTVDVAFDQVVAACADQRGGSGTWITGSMARAYGRLHELGWAHSIEVWENRRLVGGLYGVQVGGVFTGESKFHRVPDASKVALLDLADRFEAAGGMLLDVQLTTDHLRSLGAVDLPREQFLSILGAERERNVRLSVEQLPAGRLAQH